jgi:hypothetical protein
MGFFSRILIVSSLLGGTGIGALAHFTKDMHRPEIVASKPIKDDSHTSLTARVAPGGGGITVGPTLVSIGQP